MLAGQDPDDLVDAVILDADGAGGAVGGTVVQVEVVGLQHRRRDDGERALRLAAQPPLQPVLGVDVPVEDTHLALISREETYWNSAQTQSPKRKLLPKPLHVVKDEPREGDDHEDDERDGDEEH